MNTMLLVQSSNLVPGSQVQEARVFHKNLIREACMAKVNMCYEKCQQMIIQES